MNRRAVLGHLLDECSADLQWPATDPANAGVRDEFRLNTFSPTSGPGSTPPPTPPAVRRHRSEAVFMNQQLTPQTAT